MLKEKHSSKITLTFVLHVCMPKDVIYIGAERF